jgi:signal transduction histidine kinase
MSTPVNRRILLIDDNASIHADYRKILGSGPPAAPARSEARAAFFGAPQSPQGEAADGFELESAYQGEEGLARVREARAAGRPYALAFVDVRMPPGIDGVETSARLFELDPELQVVICTAFADYSWEALAARLGRSDRLLILKKPFDPIEVVQLATALAQKWASARGERESMAEMQRAVQEARAYGASLTTINRALEAANAGAEANSVLKSQFLERLSAVLKESGAALLAALELAGEPGQGEEGRRRSVQTAAERCSEICNTARNLALEASLDLGRIEPVPQSFSPGALLDAAAARWRARAERRGLRLTSECLGVVPVAVRGDPGLVARIVDVLVENALRFTPQGSVRLTVELPLRDEGQDPELVYSVIDSGPGIAAHAQPQAFEAFVHDAGWAARNQGGHFSLYTARRLARFLGGDLELESLPGAGARFRLRLPVGDLDGIEFGAYPPGPLPAAGAPQHAADPRA